MNNIEAEFLPYDESLALKELGFNEPCFGYYKYDELIIEGKYKNTDHGFSISAPLFSQAFRFFREKYSWQHSIQPTSDQHSFSLGYNYWVWNYKTGEEYWTEPKDRPAGDWEYETYEEAELECLKKLIEIVKTK